MSFQIFTRLVSPASPLNMWLETCIQIVLDKLVFVVTRVCPHKNIFVIALDLNL